MAALDHTSSCDSFSSDVEARVTAPRRNRLGEIGLGLSLVALVGLFLAAYSGVAAGLVFVGVPATLISVAALFRKPRRMAGWALVIGAFVCLYVPTFLLFFMMAMRR